ncbi:protein of unknown function [Nitrospira defluvii]|uniref:Uncharacterized protein n=1 Tax=Nitrospira defluvii TaxID=330214 RepID=D8PGC0_9BACT|nr:protein of unknown function [Nitrospira defluvii]
MDPVAGASLCCRSAKVAPRGPVILTAVLGEAGLRVTDPVFSYARLLCSFLLQCVNPLPSLACLSCMKSFSCCTNHLLM